MSKYADNVLNRSRLRFYFGVLARLKSYLRQALIRQIARYHGATIGKSSVITYQLAKNANANLIVGDHCCISTADIDLRAKVTIGNFVMLSRACRIMTASHNVHSPDFETIKSDLVIEDYCWLVGCKIIPRVSRIGYGAVCGMGSVITKDVPPMAIMGGNPAQVVKERACVHSDYPPEALLGGDLLTYWETYQKLRNKR